MDLKLRTLGGLSLEGSELTARLPLLLLCYLALSDKEKRGKIAEIFYAHQSDKSKENKLKSIDDALDKLRKVSPELIIKEDEDTVRAHIKTDAHDLEEALKNCDYEGVLHLYQGHFLEGIEYFSIIRQSKPKQGNKSTNSKNKSSAGGLSIELQEWITEKRENYKLSVSKAMLHLAEQHAFNEHFDEGAKLALQAYKIIDVVSNPENISYPLPEEYKLIHTLLLANNHIAEAQDVKQEFEKTPQFHEFDVVFCKYPKEARDRLIHLYNLPSIDPSFIGREDKLTELDQLLQEGTFRLLTIKGIAGVGKTELAVKLAKQARNKAYAKDGIHFVRLDSVRPTAEQSAILLDIVKVMGLSLQGGNLTTEDLVGKIAEQSMLLVFDNFEHLLQHATLFSEFIRDCPNLRVVVTSRAKLNLKEEYVFELKGLPYPQEDNQPVSLQDIDKNLEGIEAIKLFKFIAEQQGMTLTENDLPHVVRIAQLVEGLPLAIKLVSGWANTVSYKKIAEDVAINLDKFLSGGNQDDDERHRSARATFDYSYSLLDSKEQKIFRELSVFAGGFDLEAAEQVTKVIPQALRALIDKSLLSFDRSSDRYSFHPLIHHYAREKLSEVENDYKEAKDSHAEFYLSRLMFIIDAPTPEIRNNALKELTPNRENVSAAWQWAVQNVWCEWIAKAAHALERFFHMSARYQEGANLLALASEHLDKDNSEHFAALGNTLSSQGYLLNQLVKVNEAITCAEEGLDLSKKAKDFQGQAIALNTLGACYNNYLADFQKAEHYFQLSLTASEFDQGYKAMAMFNLANVERRLGEYAKARELYEESYDLFQRMQKHLLVVQVACEYGLFLLEVGSERKKIKTVLLDAIALAHRCGSDYFLLRGRHYLAKLLLANGEVAEAMSICEEMLVNVRRQSRTSLEADVLITYAEILLTQKDFNKALYNLERSLDINFTLMKVPYFFTALIIYLDALIESKQFNRAIKLLELLKQENFQNYMIYSDKQCLKQIEKSKLEKDSYLIPKPSIKNQELTIESLLAMIKEGLI